jgi:alanyl-tRNA synthetase
MMVISVSVAEFLYSLATARLFNSASPSAKLTLMNAEEIRQKYLAFFKARDHKVLPRALLVPQNDATTLFTGSGMQPLIPYLLGEKHPQGNRLTDSQTCLRAQDIDEVGDNRHTTFFEMLGNWSLGDYFKEDQINWFWQFITEEIKLDPQRIYVSCFIGDEKNNIPKDMESAEVWKKIFTAQNLRAETIDIGTEEDGYKIGGQDKRISFYGDKNWWCRAGDIDHMPEGEPGGPDTEMFYLFPEVVHNTEYGPKCHVNCDCGRFIELGNSVFMEYVKTKDGFAKLPKRNVDYGGGLERIAAAAIDSPDIYKISLLWPLIEVIEKLSSKKYDANTAPMRVIADHIRGAVFLAVDGISPSNKNQGYVMRRLLRRAINYSFNLGIESQFIEPLAKVVIDGYSKDYPELKDKESEVIDILTKEEKIFRQTLRKGLRELEKLKATSLSGQDIFKLYDTYGFPTELSLEEAFARDIKIDEDWHESFNALMEEQKHRSQTAAKGTFKGGLGGHDLIHKKYHTATHLLYQSLRNVLGDHVVQHGSNITEERLRFDFSHPQKMTDEEIKQVEEMVNQQINNDLSVSYEVKPTDEALKDKRVLGAFGDRYGDSVKIYIMKKDNEEPFSVEICGGPHVNHTGELADEDKKFKILKEESSSSGIRRIKAALV